MGKYLKLAHAVAREGNTTPLTPRPVVEEDSELRGREVSKRTATKATKATKGPAHVAPRGGDKSDISDQSPLSRILTLREVLAEINCQGSGPAKNAELFRRGELSEDRAVEYVARAILNRRGRSFEGWRVHVPTVRAALTHGVGCDCEVCG